jgi:hypothetical protein
MVKQSKSEFGYMHFTLKGVIWTRWSTILIHGVCSCLFSNSTENEEFLAIKKLNPEYMPQRAKHNVTLDKIEEFNIPYICFFTTNT